MIEILIDHGAEEDMGLVVYSESEGSDEEDQKPASIPKPKAPSSSKAPPKKVVDPTKPHKILVNLPEPVKDHGDAEEPPSKKPRLGGGGGGLGGFNSLLPAPKGPAKNGSDADTRRGGLGKGIALKTGATPGFSRNPAPQQEEKEQALPDATASNDATRIDGSGDSGNAGKKKADADSEAKPRGNAMMFKPLSVARNPHKKKKVISSSTSTVPAQKEHQENTSGLPRKAPTVSLFSMHSADALDLPPARSAEDYQPLVYNVDPDAKEPIAVNGTEMIPTPQPQHQSAPPNQPQSLDAIAADLNLSASARRQLMGRNVHNPGTINVVNFNTDNEYASNELLRQSGEQQVKQPVRSIAPGKHSLKQLVNAVQSQKEALDEHFASGKRNKKEAGSRYGW